jgi:signal transduction histidine kinase
LKRRPAAKQTIGYIAVLAGSLAVAIVSSWLVVADQFDESVYDFMFRLNPPRTGVAHSVVLGIDDASFNELGGPRAIRGMLAKSLDLLAPAQPRAVAIDLVLTDSEDKREDRRLAQAMQGVKNLVLVTDLAEGRWQNPLPAFRAHAAGLGHDKADQNSRDGVTREIPLEERTDRERYWALALETFRVARGQRIILESPPDLQVGSEIIPAARSAEGNRPLRVLFSRQTVPEISLKDLIDRPALASQFHDKTVFVGITSITGAQDRVRTPLENGRISGVEVHAQLFETLEGGRFLTDASNLAVLGVCCLAGALAGVIFAFLSGWSAYLSAAALLLAAHATPFAAFRLGIVFPYFAPFAAVWLTCAAAASYQHFVVRRKLFKAEADRQRYQQAIHFVTHEMRTPLTAIQGSSELMGRYNLTDEKRKQIADMINQESKRLARMIQTFLDVERLSDGQLELKREAIPAQDLIEVCIRRAQQLAERKQIAIRTESLEGAIEGDRELMEYVVYNLLTNAIKYSNSSTTITLACRMDSGRVRLSVQDQGIGMDAKELRQIFQKFYRTKRAEASGEAGTGIGLSIVEQIVHHHFGKMEVTSQPGQGSCFTVVLPAHSRASQPPAVSV